MSDNTPASFIEQAKRHEAIAKKLREVAQLLGGVSAESVEMGPRPGKLSGLLHMLKDRPMKVREVMSNLGVSRPSVYAWIAKNKAHVVNSDGVISLKP